MIGWLITLGVIGAYLAGWLVTAVLVTRSLAAAGVGGHCHAEQLRGGSYVWSHRGLCEKNCRPGCWRSNDAGGLTGQSVALGSSLALIWPVLIFPAVVYTLAKRSLDPAADLRRIAELERELGIGDRP